MLSSFFKSKKLLTNQFFVEHPAPPQFKPVKENYISFKQGTIVYSPGELSDAIYLLISGTVIKRTPQSNFDLAEEVIIKEESYFGKEEVADSSERKSIVICDTNCTVYKISKSDLLDFFPSVFFGGALTPETDIIPSGSPSFEEELARAEADYETFLSEDKIPTENLFENNSESSIKISESSELDDLLSYSAPLFTENPPVITEPEINASAFSFNDNTSINFTDSFQDPVPEIPPHDELSIPPWELEEQLAEPESPEKEPATEESHPFDDFYIPSGTEANSAEDNNETRLITGLFFEDLQVHLTDIINKASTLQLRHPLKEEYYELEQIIQDSGNMLGLLELYYFQDIVQNDTASLNDFSTIIASIERPLQRYALKFNVRLYKKVNESGTISLSTTHALKLFLLSIQILINQTVKFKALYLSTELRFDTLLITIGVTPERDTRSGKSSQAPSRLAPVIRGLLTMLEDLCNNTNSEHDICFSNDIVSTITFSFNLHN